MKEDRRGRPLLIAFTNTKCIGLVILLLITSVVVVPRSWVSFAPFTLSWVDESGLCVYYLSAHRGRNIWSPSSLGVNDEQILQLSYYYSNATRSSLLDG